MESFKCSIKNILSQLSGLPGERSVVIYDIDVLLSRYAALVEAFPSNSLHAIAIKANPLIGLLSLLVERGAGLEAASYEEVELALAAGCKPEKIVYDSPAKTIEELKLALKTGVNINADSSEEIHRLHDVMIAMEKTQSLIGVRIRPGIKDGHIRSTSVGGVDSRFGISTEEFSAHVMPLLDSARNLSISGLHVHAGSQGLSLDSLVESVEVVVKLACHINGAIGRDVITYIDIGGGLPVSYDESPEPTFSEYSRLLKKKLPSLFESGFRIITEFGRSIFARTAIAISRIEYVKPIHGKSSLQAVLVTHLGADFLLRPAYAPDHWKHRFSLLDADGNPKLGCESVYDIVGPLCFSGDVIGRQIRLPRAVPGDYLVIHDVGAYCLSMWSRHCNRSMPLVLGCYDGGSALVTIKDRESSEDIVRLWS